MEKYAELTKNKKTPIFQFIQKKYFIILIVPILIIGVVLLYLMKPSSLEQTIRTKIELKKVDGANPATAFFSYHIPETKSSLFVSFGDECPVQYLSPAKQTISHYYRHPGIFNVSIKNGNQVVSDTLRLFIPTNGWQALAHYYKQEHTERYFPIPMDVATSNNVFHATRKNLASIGIDTTQIVVLRLDNFKETGINGDSFNLKTRIKNVNYWPAIRCYSAYINVIGENGRISYKLTNQGCSQFGEFTISEKTANGSYADLTNFSLDIKSWNDVEISNDEHNVSVSINSQTVSQESYNNSIGNIVGISLQFHGSGYVDYIEMYDKENNPIFVKDF